MNINCHCELSVKLNGDEKFRCGCAMGDGSVRTAAVELSRAS